ncbi:MAG: TPM domain-containing protein, partial [Synergistaceae bacterium]|nr:TPM domain-containing protein [Synergistaceae bacterium]
TDFEAFATALFNEWGVGRAEKNDGIMFLLSVKERSARIELGSGYPLRFDSVMQGIMDDTMIPYFKGGKYSEGLLEGVKAVIASITNPAPWWERHITAIAIAVLLVLCLAGYSCMRSGRTGWGWTFFAAAGALVMFMIYAMTRGGKSGGGGGGGKGFGGGSSRGGGASGKW